jgi:CheY-like chemotaxis protein
MDKKEVLKKFLETNEVLIVDKNPSSRNRLLKTMVDLGAKRHTIHSVGTLQESQDIIQTKNIGIVLSDYFIGGGSGFDLFKLLREKYPNKKELCLILVTSNISQTAVAKAAEEDVDSFIIKPYTIQSIQENLISTVSQKIKPSDYILKIEEGKAYLATAKYEEAIAVLNVARGMHPKPALALFYIGQAEYLRNRGDVAADSYVQGLNFNNIHYKCLVGLYEVFMREEKSHEAYQVVKKIAKYFPANPDRLAQIIRLAVRTGNYQDMQMYYEIFTSLDVRLQVLTNYIGAGMYIAGKYCLLNSDKDAALQYFDNIAVSCAEFSKFLRAVITLLVENDLADDAEKFLSRFDKDAKDGEDYLVADFLVSSRKFTDPNFIIKIGLELWNKKIRDHRFLETLVGAMEQGGYKEEKIGPYREELRALAPEKSNLSA